MTGFLASLAARAVGEPPALRPRTVHLFEPRPAAAVGSLPGLVEESATTDVLGAPHGEAGPNRDGGRSPERSRRRREDMRPASTPTDYESPLLSPSAQALRGQRELRRAAREGAVRAFADLTESPSVPRQPERAASAAAPQREEARSGESGRPGRDASASPPNVDVEAAAASIEARPESSPETTRGGPPVPADSRSRERDDLPSERSQPARPASSTDNEARVQPRSPRPSPTPAPPSVDVAAILREEVYRALVAQGAVAAKERPLVQEPGRKPPNPRRGTAVVRANGVTTKPTRGVPADPSPGREAPSVQVHIDRVSVTRAPAPAAPLPAQAPSRPLVDHAAYLARRRERG